MTTSGLSTISHCYMTRVTTGSHAQCLLVHCQWLLWFSRGGGRGGSHVLSWTQVTCTDQASALAALLHELQPESTLCLDCTQ